MNTWTDEEVATLLANYNSVPNDVLQSLIPNKSRLGIYKKAYKLGLRQTEETKFANRSLGKRTAKHKEFVVTKKGYRMVYEPLHPRASRDGRVFEHIIVWEREHGKPVPDGCSIHHVNGDKADNRPENLIMLSDGEHTTLHNKNRKHSQDARRKIANKAKERLADARNHPNFKEINVSEMVSLADSGMSVASVCKQYGINKTTYYKKLKRGF